VGYYPPEDFKILLYFPADDRFAVSEEACERYAFDSYYQVNLSGVDPVSAENGFTFPAVRNYDFTWRRYLSSPESPLRF
jgi:hypothetical protein